MATHNAFVNEIGRDLHDLEKAIGYTFNRLQWLRQAVTHSSFTNELGVPEHHLLSNERMEFLGDSVLSMIVSEYLFTNYPQLPEGNLSKMRSSVVCGESLASYAGKIGLGEYLYLGVGEQNSRTNPTVLENAFEATIAAIFLDAGSGEKAKDCVKDFVLPFIEEELRDLAPLGYSKDYKSLLQQITQETDKMLPEYELLEDKGEPGPERFVVRVMYNSNELGRGAGPKRQKAEIAAARAALQLMGLIKS